MNENESVQVRGYANYLINWIAGKGDIELDPLLEFEMIRIICDSVEMYRREGGYKPAE